MHGNDIEVDIVELKKRMVEQGLDKTCDLASKSNVSRPTLTGILSGRSRPSTAVICRLARALNMADDEIGKVFFHNSLRE